MADVTLFYKGSKIVELSATGNKTLKTAGKYCDADIELAYVKSGGEPVEPDLPNEYQRVEYLEFVPNIGIFVTIPTTGYILFFADCISTKQKSGDEQASTVFGYRVGSTASKDFTLGFNKTSTKIDSYIRSSSEGFLFYELDNYTLGDRVTIAILLKEPRDTAVIGRYLGPTVDSMTNNDSFEGRFFSLKGIDAITGDTVAWFVPCYRKADNEIGVYDHIAQAFYSDRSIPYRSYTLGSITAGPDVN